MLVIFLVLYHVQYQIQSIISVMINTNIHNILLLFYFRVNRRWMYDKIEIEGNDFVLKNDYNKKLTY